MVNAGLENRMMATQQLNSNSSRSHSILQIEIQKRSSTGTITIGHYAMIDLAGSERVKKTEAEYF